jgi:hypothetical protein
MHNFTFCNDDGENGEDGENSEADHDENGDIRL